MTSGSVRAVSVSVTGAVTASGSLTCTTISTPLLTAAAAYMQTANFNSLTAVDLNVTSVAVLDRVSASAGTVVACALNLSTAHMHTVATSMVVTSRSIGSDHLAARSIYVTGSLRTLFDIETSIDIWWQCDYCCTLCLAFVRLCALVLLCG